MNFSYVALERAVLQVSEMNNSAHYLISWLSAEQKDLGVYRDRSIAIKKAILIGICMHAKQKIVTALTCT